MVIVLLWGVLAQERSDGTYAGHRVPAGREALRLTSGDVVLVPLPILTDAPGPDPERDGRWWAVVHTKRGWERWDGPYFMAESCADDINNSHAQQHPRWRFDCAEAVNGAAPSTPATVSSGTHGSGRPHPRSFQRFVRSR